MNAYKYNGPSVILGRFGPVKKGDIMLLTDREAECIKTDKRFQPAKSEATPEQEEAIKRQEIAEMNREDLVAYCKQIAEVDPTFVFKEDMEHTVLLAKVRQRMDQQTKNPA